MTLSEFLLARIAEDEAVARINTGGDLIPTDCWGPERVLAECEAKRLIVENARPVKHAVNDFARGWDSGAGIAVQYLAAVYADHPDYQQEWF